MFRVPPSSNRGLGLVTSPTKTGLLNGHISCRRLFVRRRIVLMLVVMFALFAGVYRTRTASADEWQPISPEELKMTSVAEAPGAPAVILYRQVDRDDSART